MVKEQSSQKKKKNKIEKKVNKMFFLLDKSKGHFVNRILTTVKM